MSVVYFYSENFLTFWHHNVLQAHLYISCPCPKISYLSKESCFLFSLFSIFIAFFAITIHPLYTLFHLHSSPFPLHNYHIVVHVHERAFYLLLNSSSPNQPLRAFSLLSMCDKSVSILLLFQFVH